MSAEVTAPEPAKPLWKRLRNDPWFAGIGSGLIVAGILAFTVEVLAIVVGGLAIAAAVFWLVRDYVRLRRYFGTTQRFVVVMQNNTGERFDALEKRLQGLQDAPKAAGALRQAAARINDEVRWRELLQKASEQGWQVEEKPSATGVILYTFTMFPGGYSVQATSTEEPKAVMLRLREAKPPSPFRRA
jgi:hypothetical protein